METIELARVRLGTIHNLASNRQHRARGTWTTGATFLVLCTDDSCVQLLARLVAMCRASPIDVGNKVQESAGREATIWRIAPLAHSRGPAAAGIFKATLDRSVGGENSETPRPLLLMRAYSQPHSLEIELERELDFPYTLPTLLKHMQTLFPQLEVIQPVQQVVVTLPPRQPSRQPTRGAHSPSTTTDATDWDDASSDPSLSGACDEASSQASEKTPKARRRGAPPLACNVWLQAQLARLPDPTQYHILYKPWLARYRALRGFYPQEPRRSFRAAIAGARKRLEEQ